MKLSTNKVRCPYDCLLLYCGSSEKTRKLHAQKDFDTLQSNDRENLKIIILMNKFCSRVGFLKNSLCKLASTFTCLPKQVRTRTFMVCGYSLLEIGISGPSQNTLLWYHFLRKTFSSYFRPVLRWTISTTNILCAESCCGWGENKEIGWAH